MRKGSSGVDSFGFFRIVFHLVCINISWRDLTTNSAQLLSNLGCRLKSAIGSSKWTFISGRGASLTMLLLGLRLEIGVRCRLLWSRLRGWGRGRRSMRLRISILRRRGCIDCWIAFIFDENNIMIVIKNLLRAGTQLSQPLVRQTLLSVPIYNMAFMQLFERNKTPA